MSATFSDFKVKPHKWFGGGRPLQTVATEEAGQFGAAITELNVTPGIEIGFIENRFPESKWTRGPFELVGYVCFDFPVQPLINDESHCFSAPTVESFPFAKFSSNRNIPSLSASSAPGLIGVSRSISPELAVRIRELIELPEGWDGEDAKPIKVTSLAMTLMLLRELQTRSDFKLPFIAPTFDGAILLDWAGNERTLEAQSDSGSWSVVGTLRRSDRPKEYFSSTVTDVAELQKYYAWFNGEVDVWPA